jgi:hypothetical protein
MEGQQVCVLSVCLLGLNYVYGRTTGVCAKFCLLGLHYVYGRTTGVCAKCLVA